MNLAFEPTTLPADDQSTHTFTVTIVTGVQAVTGVELRTALDPRLQVTWVDGDVAVEGLNETCAPVAQAIRCPLGTLPGSRTFHVVFSYTIAPHADPGTVQMTMRLLGAGGTYDLSAAAGLTLTMPASQPLHLSKHFADATAEAGDTSEHELTLTALAGATDLVNVVVRDQLDPRLVLVSAGPNDGDGDCAIAGQLVTCPMGDLASGASRSIRIAYFLSPSATPGTLTNTAYANAVGVQEVAASDVLAIMPGRDTIQLWTSFEDATIQADDLSDHGFDIIVAAGSAVTDIVVTDTLDPRIIATSAGFVGGSACTIDGQTVSCAISSLQDPATIHVAYRLIAGAETGGVENTVYAVGTGAPDSASATGSVEVVAPPGVLWLTKRFLLDEQWPSLDITNVMRITVSASSPIEGTVVTDLLDPRLQAFQVTLDGGSGCHFTGVAGIDQGVTCELGSVSSKRTVEVRLVVPPGTEPGTVTNTVHATGTGVPVASATATLTIVSPN
jgi:hypothetical protein